MRAFVPNSTSWEALIVELEKQSSIVKWVKVPSLLGIEGNMETHRIINQG